MPSARDDGEEEREAARRLWRQAFDRLADCLRELQSRETGDDGDEPRDQ